MCEIAEVYEVDKRKARKDHRCEECRGTIKSGEIYCYHHGVYDGGGFSHKVCVDCEQIRTELNKGLPTYEQVCVGEVQDSVFEGNEADIKRFIEIKIKRGCPLQPWMTKSLSLTHP